MNHNKGWDEKSLRKYDIPFTPVPKYTYSDPKVLQLLKDGKPVIITDSELATPCEKWDLEYLQTHMSETLCTVIFSKDHKFKYYDDKSVKPEVKAKFTAPTRKETMKFSEFAKTLKDWKPGDDRIYLQETLNSTVGAAIVKDFMKFNWSWIGSVQKAMSWGMLTLNLLLISMEGNVTPCHYDEQENLFAQVRGYKRFLLFPPDMFHCLYPYPTMHPHDRQSQVDFEKPDLRRFPRFVEAEGKEAIVGPGDVLYIPIYWWHQVESLASRPDAKPHCQPYSVSINFWYKSGPTGKVEYPLRGHHKVTIMRNIEKMVLEALQDPDEVAPLLRAMVLGRYHDFSQPSSSHH